MRRTLSALARCFPAAPVARAAAGAALTAPLLALAPQRQGPSAHEVMTQVSTAARTMQVGRASWYGGRFDGRRTASGERFDKNALVSKAAARRLGFLRQGTAPVRLEILSESGG